jgi:hypothetical protein
MRNPKSAVTFAWQAEVDTYLATQKMDLVSSNEIKEIYGGIAYVFYFLTTNSDIKLADRFDQISDCSSGISNTCTLTPIIKSVSVISQLSSSSIHHQRRVRWRPRYTPPTPFFWIFSAYLQGNSQRFRHLTVVITSALRVPLLTLACRHQFELVATVDELLN